MELTLLSTKLSSLDIAHQEITRAQLFQTFGIFRIQKLEMIRESEVSVNSFAEDMKTGFWLSEDPIGEDIICPRDGRAGCALVDWIPRCERREQTHFMSWTWKYSLQQVQAGKARECSPQSCLAKSETHSML